MRQWLLAQQTLTASGSMANSLTLRNPDGYPANAPQDGPPTRSPRAILAVTGSDRLWRRARWEGIIRPIQHPSPPHAAPMTEITCILSAIEQGDPHAASQLLPLVYDELRRLAAQKLAQEAAAQTLQPTALVHEAYLRLVGDGDVHWDSRGHFFAAAAEAMRRILVDQARRKQAGKHGGQGRRVPLDAADAGYHSSADELLDIDEALTRLAAEDPQAARLIQLRYFAGLSVEDAAAVVGISRSTAYEHWSYARVRLRTLLHGE